MVCVGCAFFNPRFQQAHLGGRQVLVLLGGWHFFVGILGKQTIDKHTFFRMAGHDGDFARLGGMGGRFALIEPQLTLALFLIWSVAI